MKAFLQIFGALMSLIFLLEAVLTVDLPEGKDAARLHSFDEYSSDPHLTSNTHSGSYSQTRSGSGAENSGSGSGRTSGQSSASSSMSFGASGSGSGDSSGSSRGSSGSSGRGRY